MLCHDLDTAHAAVCGLITDFSENEVHYLAPNYSEAQARISFIDKLWQALGWDVTHQQQKNPYAQEVKVEDPQKILGANRRADYAFHTAPNFRDARFFCEAKKPHVKLRTDADAAFQTLRYGWNAGTPLAVLTDFEQTHILDCRAKPDIETALARSHRFFHYKDWLDPAKFAEFYYLFSREAFRDASSEIRQLRKKLLSVGHTFGEWLNINQAIALKLDRAACITQVKKTQLHHEILDGRHINRYVTGTSPNFFKFDISKIHSCKREDIFLIAEKILFRRVGASLIATLDTQQKFALNTVVVITLKPACPYNIRFVLGLFNSNLQNFAYTNFLKSTKKVFSEIQARQIEQLAFPNLDLKKPEEKKQHDRMVQLVEAMLATQQQLAAAVSDTDRTYYQSKAAGLDRQINELTFDLYDLTGAERSLVASQ